MAWWKMWVGMHLTAIGGGWRWELQACGFWATQMSKCSYRVRSLFLPWVGICRFEQLISEAIMKSSTLPDSSRAFL
jgi:hypothetical protein